ncbi:hypothetical protein Hanom_Chr07g00629831 [Helianthus anomalus]
MFDFHHRAPDSSKEPPVFRNKTCKIIQQNREQIENLVTVCTKVEWQLTLISLHRKTTQVSTLYENYIN